MVVSFSRTSLTIESFNYVGDLKRNPIHLNHFYDATAVSVRAVLGPMKYLASPVCSKSFFVDLLIEAWMVNFCGLLSPRTITNLLYLRLITRFELT